MHFSAMFTRIKTWSCKLKKRLSRQSTIEFTSELMLDGFENEHRDPRELPRPRNRKMSLDKNGYKSDSAMNESTTTTLCHCHNCTILMNDYAECGVCTEPLQAYNEVSTNINACATCGNVFCVKCAEKLPNCAFCRATFSNITLPCFLGGRTRNLAMERLLEGLQLPCRNYRLGCQAMLTTKDRLTHELTCAFTPIGCPLQKLCKWHGESHQIIRHLKDYHNVSVVPANGINFEIYDLRAKMHNTLTTPRHYSVCLVCYNNIFFCKIFLHKNNLKVSLSHGGFMNNVQQETETATVNSQFSATIEVKSSYKTLRGSMQLAGNGRQFEIPCKAFLSPTGRDSDLVNISIVITQMSLV